MGIGPNDTLGEPRNLDVIKPDRFARNYPVFAGLQLEAFSRIGDFDAFRPDLGRALAYADGSKGSRPTFGPMLMFKILVIQMLNNLSDERTEYLINDRLSCMRFLGLASSDRVPDAKRSGCFVSV